MAETGRVKQMDFALLAMPASRMMADMMSLRLVAVDDDIDHFFFGRQGKCRGIFRALHAGALAWMHRAARRARAAGRVHDQSL